MERNRMISHNQTGNKNRGRTRAEYQRLTLPEIKSLFRAEARRKRDALGRAEISLLSEKICETLQSHPCFLKAETIYFYYPLGSEADLLPLAELALSLGKKAAFPRVCGDDMDFYQIHALTEFEKGSFGVMEPTGTKRMEEANALVIVPGLAFDACGGRMGYGKGYYDRYFVKYPGCRKIGICYETQIIPKAPCGKKDIFMDMLVTDQRIYMPTR